MEAIDSSWISAFEWAPFLLSRLRMCLFSILQPRKVRLRMPKLFGNAEVLSYWTHFLASKQSAWRVPCMLGLNLYPCNSQARRIQRTWRSQWKECAGGNWLFHSRLRKCHSRNTQTILDCFLGQRQPKEAPKSSQLIANTVKLELRGSWIIFSCILLSWEICGSPTWVSCLKSKVRLQTRFSSIFTLEKGKVFTADNPIVMYERKTFALCYKARALRHRKAGVISIVWLSIWLYIEVINYISK